jgi:FAD binding domain
MGLFPMGNRRFRLIASNPFSKPEKGTAPSLEELQRIYDQRSHIPARFRDMSWSSWFRINSRMVPRLKIGRLFLGGDAAHIHSPAGAQGMNTGIQDMVNLSWKLALVMKGQALLSLLDTYEQDRLPVMRNVLFKTENLTDIIGSENPVVRSLFNHLGPFIGGARLVQEDSTARMSQLALDYRKSPLSADHAHSGSLHAGDRTPDLRIRHRADSAWHDGSVFDVLDPLRFVLLVAHGDETAAVDAGLHALAAESGGLMRIVDIAPPADAEGRAAYDAALGRGSSVFLVRPDGYLGLAAEQKTAGQELAAYRKLWFAPARQANAH